MHRKTATYAISVILLTLGACSSVPQDVAKDEESAVSGSASGYSIDQYKIGIDDVLQINVWKNPELSIVAPVRPDGKVSMPLIGDVAAGHKSPQDVAADIEKKLAEYIRSPKVAVIVTELRSHLFLSRIRITGAVNNPVSVPYRQGMTVLDAVLEAGGLNDFASPNRAKLYRKTESGTRIIEIHLDDILSQGKLETNIDLRAGDIISVPEKLF